MDNTSDEIAKIKHIVRTIGTPFNAPQRDQIDSFNTFDFYQVAKKNKIGLLFLESLPDKLLVGEIQKELGLQRMYQTNLKQTALRVASILDNVHCKYAIIKSNFPFPAVPNDVDLLILGDRLEYEKATRALAESSFEKLGEAPLESCFHDLSGGQHKDPKIKDSFDVDVYKEVGAGHIIYIDKKNLLSCLSGTTVDGYLVSSLTPIGEMAVSIFHSIYPERIFTLLLHYQILYTVAKMSQTEAVEFTQRCSKNGLRSAALIALSLSEMIQEICFGKTPQQLTSLRKQLGNKTSLTIDKLPYKYSTFLVLNSFWNKKNDPLFARSFFRQLISMLNLKYARYVFSVNRERRIRDTY